MSMMDQTAGDYESDAELLRFLKESNPTLKTYEEQETGGIIMHDSDNVIDGLESEQFIRCWDPVRTVDVR